MVVASPLPSNSTKPKLHAESGLEFRPPGCREGQAPLGAPSLPTEEVRIATTCRPGKEEASSTVGGGSGNGAATAPKSVRRGQTLGAPETECVVDSSGSPLLTVTMENGAAEEVPRAVWLGRVAAVMEARGDRDEAVRLYGEAAVALTGGERGCGVGAVVGDSNHRPRNDGGISGTTPAVSASGRGLSSRGGGGGAGMSAATIVGGGCGSGGGVRNLFPYSARAHHLASMIERSYRRHFSR